MRIGRLWIVRSRRPAAWRALYFYWDKDLVLHFGLIPDNSGSGLDFFGNIPGRHGQRAPLLKWRFALAPWRWLRSRNK